MIMPGLNIYLGSLLFFVACVMGALSMQTVVQVFRLRNKRLSWRAGTLKGFPLFSTVFLMISFVFTTVMWFNGGFWGFIASGFYLFISASWFVTSYFSSKRYITDNGIVKNVNDPSQTIAWHQIRDFVEQDEARERRYTFIYSEKQNEYNMQRLELKIPPKKYNAFKKLISHKLGRRISCYSHTSIQIENFD